MGVETMASETALYYRHAAAANPITPNNLRSGYQHQRGRFLSPGFHPTKYPASFYGSHGTPGIDRLLNDTNGPDKSALHEMRRRSTAAAAPEAEEMPECFDL